MGRGSAVVVRHILRVKRVACGSAWIWWVRGLQGAGWALGEVSVFIDGRPYLLS